MARLRVSLLALGLALGIFLNAFIAPQLSVPSKPVFNGPDVAENWDWRSMAIWMHPWWLANRFPGARVENVGFVVPSGHDDALPVGMKFEENTARRVGLEVDASQPALDIRSASIRESLRSYEQNYSRIHCRSSQDMLKRDTCYFFVAWDSSLISATTPTFVGVLTETALGKEEMGLVEKTLLQRLVGKSLTQVPTMK